VIDKSGDKDNKNKLLNKMISILQTVDIGLLVIIPVLIAIFLPAILVFIIERILYLPITDAIIGIIGACSAYICSLGGLIQVFRKEAPGFISFHGAWPVVTGIMWFIFCCVFGTVALFLGIASLIQG